MDNIFRIMHKRQRREHLAHYLCDFFLRHISLPLAHVTPLVRVDRFKAQLHFHDQDVRENLRVLRVVNFYDVGVVQLLQHPHFAFE